ncbi:hypothetical protein V6Z12_A10G082100 [Gossypium hirsutum]
MNIDIISSPLLSLYSPAERLISTQPFPKSDRDQRSKAHRRCERDITPVMKTRRRATWYVGANVEQGARVWRRRSRLRRK